MKSILTLLLTFASALLVSAQNDTYFENGAQWYLNKVNASTAWNITQGSSDVIVAVLDTGINASHPDLAGQVLAGYDFVNNDSDASDDNGHGTSVAGCIAPKTNNGMGLAGIAGNVKLLPVKILDANNAGTTLNIAKGIKYAADQGANIINISVSTTTYSATIKSAVDYAWEKGCVIVASTGNTGSNATRYPAAFDNVIAVSSTTFVDSLSSFSTYGSYVDICAPGSGILTLNQTDGYKSASGTSYSTPLVSGAAALLASLPTNLSNTQIVNALLDSTTDLGDAGHDEKFGFGLLNAGNALFAGMTASASIAAPTETIDPTLTISEVTASGVIVDVTVTKNQAFTIECSNDMNNWTALLNEVGTGATESFEVSDLTQDCGFIRITLN